MHDRCLYFLAAYPYHLITGHISVIFPVHSFIFMLRCYVMCNDISVIYVTAQMCRRTAEEVVPTVGLTTPYRRGDAGGLSLEYVSIPSLSLG